MTIDKIIDCVFEYLYSIAVRRERRKELDRKIKLYTEVYKAETDSTEKAYWLARVLNLKYERSVLS